MERGTGPFAALIVLFLIVGTVGCDQGGGTNHVHPPEPPSATNTGEEPDEDPDEEPDEEPGDPDEEPGDPDEEPGDPDEEPGEPDEEEPGEEEPEVVLPEADGWTFFGREHGGPARVHGVTADQGGNIWVAGGAEGLFLLERGAASFRRFTHEDGLTGYTDADGDKGFDVISVEGGPAGTVFVGYRALPGANNDGSPQHILKSGDADEVTLSDGGITVRHFDIYTPAGSLHIPEEYRHTDREKLSTIHRIVWNAHTGDLWFGGNHGVAVYAPRESRMLEHWHASLNGYTDDGHYTALAGDHSGIALDGEGNAWFGGAHRVGRISYGSTRNEWVVANSIRDVWPDAVPADARPEDRTDDHVRDMALTPDGTLWIGSIPNGLGYIRDPANGGSIGYVRSGLLDSKVTALEADPRDGSLWVGHIWSGLTRLRGSSMSHYDYRILGDLTSGMVSDVQSAHIDGQRVILVGFYEGGAIGLYTGD